MEAAYATWSKLAPSLANDGPCVCTFNDNPPVVNCRPVEWAASPAASVPVLSPFPGWSTGFSGQPAPKASASSGIRRVGPIAELLHPDSRRRPEGQSVRVARGRSPGDVVGRRGPDFRTLFPGQTAIQCPGRPVHCDGDDAAEKQLRIHERVHRRRHHQARREVHGNRHSVRLIRGSLRQRVDRRTRGRKPHIAGSRPGDTTEHYELPYNDRVIALVRDSAA